MPLSIRLSGEKRQQFLSNSSGKTGLIIGIGWIDLYFSLLRLPRTLQRQTFFNTNQQRQRSEKPAAQGGADCRIVPGRRLSGLEDVAPYSK
jgi:hypothetical protein